jgi:predicted aspartyl protease
MPDSTVIISGSSRLNGSASVIANYLKDNYLGMNFISQSYFSLNDQDNLSTKQMKEPDDLMNIIISG